MLSFLYSLIFSEAEIIYLDRKRYNLNLTREEVYETHILF